MFSIRYRKSCTIASSISFLKRRYFPGGSIMWTIRHRWLGNILYICFDVATISITYLLAYVIRAKILPLGFNLQPVVELRQWIRLYPLFLLPWLLFLASEGFYNHRLAKTTEGHRMLKAATWTMLLESLLILLTRIFEQVSRITVFFHWVLTAVLLLPAHRIARSLLRRMNWHDRSLIVITEAKALNSVAEKLDTILEEPNMVRNYGIIDFWNLQEPSKATQFYKGIQEVIEDIHTHPGAFDVVIAPGPSGIGKELASALRAIEFNVHSIYFLPGLEEFLSMGASVELWGDLPVIHTRNNLARPLNLAVKRIFDLVLGIILGVVLLPLGILAAGLIMLDSRGPAIFTHERIGRFGKSFRCYKFRTMYRNAERRLQEYLQKNPEKQEEWQHYHKLRGYDPRVTRVGKWFRRFSLDELPQIWNIIKGEMSFVGPRPYAMNERGKMGETASLISRARPGLTGLWQVSGRSERSFAERLRLDVYYVKNWNLWTDIEILLRTFWVVLSGRGAY